MTTVLPNTLEGLFLEGQKLYTRVSQEMSHLFSGSLNAADGTYELLNLKYILSGSAGE